jgi:DNA topoisomerase-1
MPTELGSIVNSIMCENFEDIVDVAFTATMEERLDKVEEGKLDWHNLISDFYNPFEKTLSLAEEKIGNVEIKDEVSDIVCDKCGRMMVYKQGKFGRFLACPGFPECRNTKAIVKGTGISCPKCGKEVIEKKSRRGKLFYGCTGYPECDFTSWDKPTEEKCPKCGGIMYEKAGRAKKKYCPECDTKK